MVSKNESLLETLTQETIQRIYNTWIKYKAIIDVFYVAFSGGKDSIVALDLVQRTLPHDQFVVVFGDTRMEFPDTYDVIDKVESLCKEEDIHFIRAKSKMTPTESWQLFGPPATANRWCCSVHKTSPQIISLRKYLNEYDFTGMAFTGVRADESLGRSDYESINAGKKHGGQMSYHVILEWNSAEVFTYIFAHNLLINEAYKKGVLRAGCLVCPNSTGKNEYFKRLWYKEEVDSFLNIIASTSGKTNYTDDEMKAFIESGYWRTRRSGKELCFGQDLFEVRPDEMPPEIIVYKDSMDWEKWAITVSEYYKDEIDIYVFKFANKLYRLQIKQENGITRFIFLNCGKEKDDLRFFTLIRGVIVKTLYCIGCGVCEAECKHNCIDMQNGVVVSKDCIHCQSCHNIHEHCLRYNSVRNRRTEGKQMMSLDRFYSFGTREKWLKTYCDYDGKAAFWESDGDGDVQNKRKDAFKNFILDAGLATYDKKAIGDKYTKCIPTDFMKTVKGIGATSEIAWALILCNMVYAPTFNWLVKNLVVGQEYTQDMLKMLLAEVMESDLKGLSRRNVVDSFRVFMAKTPLGKNKIFAICDLKIDNEEKPDERITMYSFVRCSWHTPDSRVILYSLYKFAEACGDYYQFRLSTLMDDSIERDGVSPSRIFGLDRETMVRILNGLSINYPDFIHAAFTLDLETITLYQEKSSADVLQLF